MCVWGERWRYEADCWPGNKGGEPRWAVAMGGEEDDGWALPAGVGGGEEDGDEGSGTTRTVGYATAMFGVFNEPLSSCSLATELLLLAAEVQHKHIKPLCWCRILSCSWTDTHLFDTLGVRANFVLCNGNVMI